MRTAVAMAALPFRIPRGGRDPGREGCGAQAFPPTPYSKQKLLKTRIKEERDWLLLIRQPMSMSDSVRCTRTECCRILRLALRLSNDTVERGRSHVAPVRNGDVTQRETCIRSPPPSAAVSALEYHSACTAGREETLVEAVIGDGCNVFVW